MSCPAINSYDNRKNESQTKQELLKKEQQLQDAEAKLAEVTKQLETEKQSQTNNVLSLETAHCGKEIISITKVDSNVVVMYADCSYSVVNESKVNFDSWVNAKLVCVAKELKTALERIQVLENKPDNDTIYDDTALQNRVSILENKPDNDTIYDDKPIKGDIANLVNQLTELKNKVVTNDDLIVVENLEGTGDLFRAIKLEESTNG